MRMRKVLGVLGIAAVGALAVLAIVLSHNSPCGASPAGAPGGGMGMKAVVARCYGPPQVLRLEEVPKPAVSDGRVLVKVHAASVNPLDFHSVRGSPYLLRLDVGIGAPRDIRAGVDFAGTVEAVGGGVTRFKVGDEVFGGAQGAFAEHVAVREAGSIAIKPAAVTFEQAAAAGIAGVTALQALRDHGHVRPGDKVLINGASGGVGTFAVQIAKALGAEVTGVCSTHSVDLVRSLGADHVIDYTKEDFTQGSARYDFILDNVGNHTFAGLGRVLQPQGRLVTIGAPPGDWIGPLVPALKALVWSPFVKGRYQIFLAELDQQDLGALADLMQSGKVKPVIDRHYPLAQVPQAVAYVESGHAHGKVVIDVN